MHKGSITVLFASMFLNFVSRLYMHINGPIIRRHGGIVPDYLLSSNEVLSELAMWSWFMYIRDAFFDLKYGLHSSWTNQNTTQKWIHFLAMGPKRCIWQWKTSASVCAWPDPSSGHWQCRSEASVQRYQPSFQRWYWSLGKDWQCLYDASVQSGSGHGNGLSGCPPCLKGLQNAWNKHIHTYIKSLSGPTCFDI